MILWENLLPRWLTNGALSARMRALQLAGKLLVPSYRFKWPQLDWWKNEEFTRYLEQFDELGIPNTDRKWMLYQLLRLTAHVSGDTAECGVYRGATSYLICRANQRSIVGSKTHHIFDSFEGLSEPGATDGTHWRKGDLKCDMKQVQIALNEFHNVSFHPGWIPTRFGDVADKKFSFVHIDVDLAGPTRESIGFFYPRMQRGGVIVCDDYGITTCQGATQAIDDFLADKPEKMLALPDGGGFLIANTPSGEPAALRIRHSD